MPHLYEKLAATKLPLLSGEMMAYVVAAFGNTGSRAEAK
jgi:hypothetical protein